MFAAAQGLGGITFVDATIVDDIGLCIVCPLEAARDTGMGRMGRMGRM